MIYLTPRMLLLLWLGIISGLPLALTAGTLTAWLTQYEINIKTIGLFAMVSAPYAFKFLWAPIMDGFNPPIMNKKFGKRRGWMALSLIVAATASFAMSLFSPHDALLAMACSAYMLAFASASFDINLDAYRIETFVAEEQASAAAVAVFGYRVGMLISGAAALKLVGSLEWSGVYQAMSGILFLGIIPLMLFPFVKNIVARPDTTAINETSKAWLKLYVLEPFRNFANHSGWQLILLFIILFKLGDAFLGFMTNPFLLQAGYTLDNIADISKVIGFIATIIGSFFGGWVVMRIGLMKSLIMGGLLQAAANLPYAYLALLTAPDLQALSVTIAVDNFCGGMSTVAFVAYISSLCNLSFTATQYALLNSFASFGRSLFTSSTGWMVSTLGWPMFFIATALIGLPSLGVLYVLNRRRPKDKAE